MLRQSFDMHSRIRAQGILIVGAVVVLQEELHDHHQRQAEVYTRWSLV